MPAYSAIILAAGKGSRTHLDYNKVFYHLDSNHTVLDRSLELLNPILTANRSLGSALLMKRIMLKKLFKIFEAFLDRGRKYPSGIGF